MSGFVPQYTIKELFALVSDVSASALMLGSSERADIIQNSGVHGWKTLDRRTRLMRDKDSLHRQLYVLVEQRERLSANLGLMELAREELLETKSKSPAVEALDKAIYQTRSLLNIPKEKPHEAQDQ